MKTIIVLELETYMYRTNDYNCPNGTSEEMPNEWFEYWQKSLSDSGLTHLKPIKKGSWFVDIDTLSLENLKIIIKKELEDIDFSNIEDELPAFSGGIAICKEHELILEPQCCGDLSNLYEWFEIKNGTNNYQNLWIGHPWIFYKIDNSEIVISDYYEQNLDDTSKIAEKVRFSQQDFLEQIEELKEKISEFQKNVHNIISEMHIDNSARIAEILVGKSNIT